MFITPFIENQGFGSTKIFVEKKLHSIEAIKAAQQTVALLFDDDSKELTDPSLHNYFCYFVSFQWTKANSKPASIVLLNFKRLKKDEHWTKPNSKN